MSKISKYFLATVIIFGIFCATVRSEYTNNSSDNHSPCAGGQAIAVNCPVSCFRTDPVCGADGVTYWCGCADAVCAGAQVAKLGFCVVGDGVNGSQALLLVHIVWLILLGFFVVFGHL